MDINKLSQEAQKMLSDRIGFRNDCLYGSGVEDVKEIITFEVMELNNDDIFTTCKNLYGINYEVIDIDDPEKTKECIDKTLEFLKKHFGTDKLNGKWLALKKNVIDFYEGEYNISEYIIPQNAIIISDLDMHGVLFVTPDEWVLKEELF